MVAIAIRKPAVAERVTAALVEIGQVRPEDLWIVFQDVERCDWAAGGLLADDR